ncbi:hypothetical protein QQS21_002000 [Conoideocrella luteorostrata]|uniref:Enterotoxin n=1 Tax=Conoideocrella luteorostrata TaxID=1105319 RepID=A0AAJ0CYX4_9HYPO|nr:hypothetical protein QQS21_002000 [Conoideocrella luteorostrata]
MKPSKFLVLFAGHIIAERISANTGKDAAPNSNTILKSIADGANKTNYSFATKAIQKRGLPTEPSRVYRVDAMPPNIAKEQGGFPPRQADLSNAKFSIYEHSHSSLGGGSSPYVSTSLRPQGAEIFASPGRVAYLYEIHATPNFIDTFTTLGGSKTTSTGEPYLLHKSEREFLATGGIKWDQVVSYTKLADGRDTGKKDRKKIANDDYNKPKYNNLKAGGPNYELAGFPDGHEAWKNEPWSKHKGADIKESGLNFADKNGKAVGLARNNPLQFNIKYPVGGSTFYVPSPNKNGGQPSVHCKRTNGGCINVPVLPEENGSATPKQIEAARKAEKVSEKEFSELATRHKFNKIPWEWEAKGVKSLSDIRTKILKYTPLKPTSPKLRPGSGIGGEIGNALWVGGVVHAFITNSTALDRAAAITAIIPFVGCSVSIAAALEHKEDTALIAMDSALCFIGDALILGGFLPLGLLVHLARLAVQLFTPPPNPPTKEEGLRARDDVWTRFLHEKVFRYIYSHSYHNPHQDFAFKLNNTLAVSAVGVISNAAQGIGALNASSETLEPDAKLDRAKFETGCREAIEKMRNASSGSAIHRQRLLLIDIPANFTSGTALSLRKVGETFNEEFVKRFTSQKNVEAYSDPKWKQFLQKVVLTFVTAGIEALIEKDPYGVARTHLVAVGEYLKTVPVAMPRLLDTAFIVGQSKGLAHIDNIELLLSGRDYIKREVQEESGVDLSDALTDMLAIRHAIEVVRVIQGQLKEEELTEVFPGGKEVRQGLQILIAIKCGKLYEDAKLAAAEIERQERGIPYILSDQPPASLVNPIIPPVPKHPKEGLLLSMILGLTDTVLETQYDEAANSLLKEEVEKMKEHFAQLRKKVTDVVNWSTFEYEDFRPPHDG